MNRNLYFTLFVTLVLLTSTLVGCASPSQGYEVTVGANQIAYKINPDYSPNKDGAEKYLDKKGPGNQVDKRIYLIEEIATVGADQVGFDGINYYGPGMYPQIPKSGLSLAAAAVIAPELAAIHYDENSKQYKLLQPGYNLVPVNKVSFFHAGTLRYRTLSPDLLQNADACGGSIKCESTLTGISLKDTVIQASADVDVIFELVINEQTTQRLGELRADGQIIQNYIATPLRSARALSSVISDKEIETAEGRAKLEGIYLDRLQKNAEGQPIRITSVNLRSITVGDTSWKAEQQKTQAALEAEKNKANTLAIQQANLAAEQRYQADQREFSRQQALKDAENQAAVNKKLFESLQGVDWRVLWVLQFGGKTIPFLTGDTLSQSPATPIPPAN